MPIIFGSENESLRDGVLAVLNKASKHKNLKVLDAGGGLNSWLGEYVSHIIDINPNYSDKNIQIIEGDINENITWSQIEDHFFDFVSCTHTLEDIRDPKFVIHQFNRVSRTGFIAVPNRRSEFQTVESANYLGYAHHRWIFHLRDRNKLEAVAKWIGISNENVLIDHLLGGRNRRLRQKFATLLPIELRPTQENFLELGILWENDIDFEYLNNDFAGPSGTFMKSSSLNFLSDPFVNFDFNFNWEGYFYNILLQDFKN